MNLKKRIEFNHLGLNITEKKGVIKVISKRYNSDINFQNTINENR